MSRWRQRRGLLLGLLGAARPVGVVVRRELALLGRCSLGCALPALFLLLGFVIEHHAASLDDFILAVERQQGLAAELAVVPSIHDLHLVRAGFEPAIARDVEAEARALGGLASARIEEAHVHTLDDGLLVAQRDLPGDGVFPS